MVKKIFNKEEMKIIKLVIRPYIIFCICIAFIVIIGTKFCNMTSDEATGYIGSMLLYMVINYVNMQFMELEDITHKNK